MNSSSTPRVLFYPAQANAEIESASVDFSLEQDCSYTQVLDLTDGTDNVPVCAQYWTHTVVAANSSCSISGNYELTWDVDCFHGKPTCYFLEKDGVTYNTQVATMSVKSQGLCPTVVEDIELGGDICDTGYLSMSDACST